MEDYQPSLLNHFLRLMYYLGHWPWIRRWRQSPDWTGGTLPPPQPSDSLPGHWLATPPHSLWKKKSIVLCQCQKKTKEISSWNVKTFTRFCEILLFITSKCQTINSSVEILKISRIHVLLSWLKPENTAVLWKIIVLWYFLDIWNMLFLPLFLNNSILASAFAFPI